MAYIIVQLMTRVFYIIRDFKARISPTNQLIIKLIFVESIYSDWLSDYLETGILLMIGYLNFFSY